jgi:orotidine-5'-phosphate decarboxylase
VVHLTSSVSEHREQKTDETYWQLSLDKAFLSKFYGTICAVQNLAQVKAINKNLKTICPGIKFFENDENTGQRSTASPIQAKKEGADYIVIGRSVTNSDRPLSILELIRQEITK